MRTAWQRVDVGDRTQDCVRGPDQTDFGAQPRNKNKFTTMAAIPALHSNLTQTQRRDLARLWITQNRQLVDVRPTTEQMEESKMDDHATAFAARLFAFLLAFLKHNLPGNENQSGSFLKNMNESCLDSYAKTVLVNEKVKLVEGRTVISVHHDEFLNEFHHYELNGEAPSEDFIRKHSFGAFLYHRPEHALAAVGSAMGLAVSTQWRKSNTTEGEATEALDRFLDTCQFIARFHHVRPNVRMMDIRTGLAYKFLTVKGHVIKARPKRLRVVTADFTCSKCGAIVTHSFTHGRYSLPTKCGTAKCRSKQFLLIRPSARYINVQELRLQEAQEESTVHAGRTPRQIEVELTHELVDVCRPGDIVMVASIVQAVNSALAEGRRGKRAQETSTYKLYLQGHSVTTMAESTRRDKNQKGPTNSVTYTQHQLQNITQLAHADHRYFGLIERRAFPFDLLVRSICPSIIGHDMVKAGILLCLLGGTPPSTAEKGNTIRCNSHILIVGDPGMGKSQMLLAATQVAARSVYVGGNTTSTTGLTVSMTKEASGEAGIEAGALVLADQGICCIDEFDKMAKTHQDGKHQHLD